MDIEDSYEIVDKINDALEKFTSKMADQMLFNRQDKGISWKEMDIGELDILFHQKVLKYWLTRSNKDLIDIANYCMMLVDRKGGL